VRIRKSTNNRIIMNNNKIIDRDLGNIKLNNKVNNNLRKEIY
jgi:hypothetical protein